MINLSIPVQAPHPHLHWTNLYKQRLAMEKHVHTPNELAFAKRLREVQESHRIQRNQQYQSETEQIHRYTLLENSRAFNQYKYQYYLGTKIDVYI